MIKLIIFSSLSQNAYNLELHRHTENLPKLVSLTLVWL